MFFLLQFSSPAQSRRFYYYIEKMKLNLWHTWAFGVVLAISVMNTICECDASGKENDTSMGSPEPFRIADIDAAVMSEDEGSESGSEKANPQNISYEELYGMLPKEITVSCSENFTYS